MKLSLDELKVDSYAIQASETELAEVKGGTSWICFFTAVIAMVAVKDSTTSSPSSGGGESPSSGGSTGNMLYGVTSDSARINGNMYYNFAADSIPN